VDSADTDAGTVHTLSQSSDECGNSVAIANMRALFRLVRSLDPVLLKSLGLRRHHTLFSSACVRPEEQIMPFQTKRIENEKKKS
jgi:hypothetical protein